MQQTQIDGITRYASNRALVECESAIAFVKLAVMLKAAPNQMMNAVTRREHGRPQKYFQGGAVSTFC